MRTESSPIGLRFQIRWLLATIVGYAFGDLAGFVLGHLVLGNVAVGVGIGALTGLLQWRVLRRHMPTPRAWIWAGAVGLPIGLGLLAAVSALWGYPFDLGWPHGTLGWALAFTVGGAITGLIQQSALQRRNVRLPGWMWIAAIGWGLSVFPQAIPADMSGNLPVLLLIFRNGLMTPGLAGLVLGSITAGGLARALSGPTPSGDASPGESAPSRQESAPSREESAPSRGE